ncbi:hypothetical protein FI667_g17130, partial [Globisporangium splendens]
MLPASSIDPMPSPAPKVNHFSAAARSSATQRPSTHPMEDHREENNTVSAPLSRNRWIPFEERRRHRLDPDPIKQNKEVESKYHKTILPWMYDYDPGMRGYNRLRCAIPLFDTSEFKKDFALRFSSTQHSDEYYIDLFFQKRFYDSKAKHNRRTSPDALCKAWNAFVHNFMSNPEAWLRSLERDRDSFRNRVDAGKMMAIHEKSMVEGLLCAVPRQYDCPMCYHDSNRLPEAALSSSNQKFKVSSALQSMVYKFDLYHQRKENEEEKEEDPRAMIFRLESVLASVRRELIQVQSENLIYHEDIKHMKEKMGDLETSLDSFVEYTNNAFDDIQHYSGRTLFPRYG